MTLDWNWFFAAFAQCGAALIGIISAFIISKLLGENDKYEYIIKELEHSSIKKNELLKKISLRHFDWHDRLNIKYDSAIEDAIREDQFSDLTDEEKLKNIFSLIPELLRVENCISYLNSRINET
ncbi:hypothetical protein VU01_13841 [Candidatus Electrothrix marina]|uniref:Uncharacterized protein n=1 Tax=Candidatus Electrothrix marina TaxID=1859130 RepID=A0A444JAR7_9BACT|nr:hypothetical protein VU01_13841 [Candidatus Electrothrix marina]